MIVNIGSVKIIAPSIKIKAMNTPNNQHSKNTFEKYKPLKSVLDKGVNSALKYQL